MTLAVGDQLHSGTDTYEVTEIVQPADAEHYGAATIKVVKLNPSSIFERPIAGG